jgi:hypothetical protein
VRDQGALQHAQGSAARDQPAKAESPVEGAKATEAKAKLAGDVAPARHGGDETSEIPKATPPAQPDGDASSEDSPMLVGSDEITNTLMILKEVSKLQFSRPRARKALRNKKDFVHRWRDLRATWSQEPDDLEEQRIEAAACIEATKMFYRRSKVKDRHDPENFSSTWLKFADAVLNKSLKWIQSLSVLL